MLPELLKSKFYGALLGTAIGDALGAGFEGLQDFTEDQIYAVADRRKVLRYTDDTHMMIGVAESLIAKNGFDGEHMASRFIHNYNWEPFRGYGPGPPKIFELIESGQSWYNASEKIYPGGSFGNGAAMRIAPVGLYYRDSIETLIQISFQSSRITHAHPLGKEGAALQAYAISLVANSNPSAPFDHARFFQLLAGVVNNPVYREKLDKMLLLLEDKDQLRVVLELGNGIEAHTAVPAAIFSFVANPDSFERAVIYAISLGGDTDTIGAMAGAISGAYLGLDSVPGKWLRKLENRVYIEALAEELWKMSLGHHD